MSQGYGREYRGSEQGSPAHEPMVWERVEWRQGDGRYTFEVAQGGLYGTVTAPQGRALTLPIVAWEGLLDALAAARKSKQRSERNMPARTGARWSEAETGELAKTFKSGGSIAQLARIHNRTQFAIEAQLERLGLWDRAARQPMGRAAGGDFQRPMAGRIWRRPLDWECTRAGILAFGFPCRACRQPARERWCRGRSAATGGRGAGASPVSGSGTRLPAGAGTSEPVYREADALRNL